MSSQSLWQSEQWAIMDSEEWLVAAESGGMLWQSNGMILVEGAELCTYRVHLEEESRDPKQIRHKTDLQGRMPQCT